MSTRMKALKSAIVSATSSTGNGARQAQRHVLTSSVPRTTYPACRVGASEAVNQVVHFGFVGDQHLAGNAESAGLSEQHQADRVHVDDERYFADARCRFAARAARECLVPMRIEQKRISRRESTHLTLARSSCCHLGIPRAHEAEIVSKDGLGHEQDTMARS